MTDEQFAAIEAREKAATKGPWYPARDYTANIPIVGAPGILELLTHSEPQIMSTAQCMADVTFAAHARQDIPDLLAEVKRLRGALSDVFDAGFAESGEGWNNEWPREFSLKQKQRYEMARAVAVMAVDSGTRIPAVVDLFDTLQHQALDNQ